MTAKIASSLSQTVRHIAAHRARIHARVASLIPSRIRALNLPVKAKAKESGSIFDVQQKAPQANASLASSLSSRMKACNPVAAPQKPIDSSAQKAQRILAASHFPPPLMNLNDLLAGAPIAAAPKRKSTNPIAGPVVPDTKPVLSKIEELQGQINAIKGKNSQANPFGSSVAPLLEELAAAKPPARPLSLQNFNPQAAAVDPADKKEPTKITSAAAMPLWKHIDQLFTRIFVLLKDLHSLVETDAGELHQRIKTRTEHLKRLSTLVQKINTVPPGKTADWSNDPEMKALIEEARALGVEIEKGKYVFDEKELERLKDNTQLVRDRFEKLTQTERADLQRYLQEASQYLQFISNLLKKIETVGDTLSRNVRPG